MRLDHFVRFLRRPKKGTDLPPPGIFERAGRIVLPASFFSDPMKGKPGLIRRITKKIGPVTQSAPLRRGVQAVCFVTFLILFFYVCWPYTAQPDSRRLVDIFVPASALEGGPEKLAERLNDPAQGAKIREAVNAQIKSWDKNDNMILGQYENRPKWVGKSLREIAKDEKREVADVIFDIARDKEEPAEERRQARLWSSQYATDRMAKEKVPAFFFLVIDPLVSISTAFTSRTWEFSLAWALGILAVCVLFPRGFCGYLCPLGTLIDCFDWAIGKRVNLFKVKGEGWWVHLKYYILLGVVVSGLFGILLSGVVAAIPVITRGMLYIIEPLQIGMMRGWHQVPAVNAGQVISIGLFVTVLGLGLLRKRFWCRYVCPSGAVFSVFNFFRVSERKVESSCIHCNKCVEICPFDAIKADFTTRTADCTLCQSCGGVCPTHAIKFVERWNVTELKAENDPPVSEIKLARRGFIGASAAAVATAVGMRKAFGAELGKEGSYIPVRPPGSVPEEQFLQMCIRCGECFKACPNKVLQPVGFQQGLEGLWTPEVKADWNGCESSCNNCGQVCPTGAIRALPLIEKRDARMGLALMDLNTCLPHAGTGACQACYDACAAAGYNAMEINRVGVKTDENGEPIEGTGFLAPIVLEDKCVGCGLCQSRCYELYVKPVNEPAKLKEAAIIVHAGENKTRKNDSDSPYEDRMLLGSYVDRRRKERAKKEAATAHPATDDSYMPDFLKKDAAPKPEDAPKKEDATPAPPPDKRERKDRED